MIAVEIAPGIIVMVPLLDFLMSHLYPEGCEGN